MFVSSKYYDVDNPALSQGWVQALLASILRLPFIVQLWHNGDPPSFNFKMNGIG
jgi:hypothetical protein